jgi:Niemann-Pick C1 protein
LVFLPVALSIAGGRGYVDPESEGTAAQDLTDRRWRAIRIHDEHSDSEDEY